MELCTQFLSSAPSEVLLLAKPLYRRDLYKSRNHCKVCGAFSWLEFSFLAFFQKLYFEYKILNKKK
jgi:hypothetical protein